ncbi:MAG TPA: hypothetical protein VHI55_02355 [Gaiellaceae bacterium]|nr:hypothetical protein [Gaiellaceae bacterium]
MRLGDLPQTLLGSLECLACDIASDRQPALLWLIALYHDEAFLPNPAAAKSATSREGK